MFGAPWDTDVLYAVSVLHVPNLCPCLRFAGKPNSPELELALKAPFFAAVVMWPIYVAWVALCKRLTRWEKLFWLVLVTWGHMLGMAGFYVFIICRYLGLEGQPDPATRRRSNGYMNHCGVRRDDLSVDKVVVLRSYCRTRRHTKWVMIPAAIVGAVFDLRCRCIPQPHRLVRLPNDADAQSSLLTRPRTRERRFAPDPETVRLGVQTVLVVGAMAGMMGTGGFFLLFATLEMWLPNNDRRALVSFLKAGKSTSRNMLRLQINRWVVWAFIGLLAAALLPAGRALAQSFRRGGTEFNAVRQVTAPLEKGYTIVVVRFTTTV